MKINYLLIVICALFFSCEQPVQRNEELLAEVADSFCVRYFNYDFVGASKYCTDDSQRWLQFAASNVTEKDLQILYEQETPARIEVTDIAYHEPDTTAIVTVVVENYWDMDKIEDESRSLVHHRVGVFRFPLVRQQDIWRIRMEDLPQSGKRSHD
ncbi:MAG: hypothetical protein J6Z18_01665 [Prevotella sp.]|nr:hypothetical protein [Prevotella sp.]